jgi:hypothetical protein
MKIDRIVELAKDYFNKPPMFREIGRPRLVDRIDGNLRIIDQWSLKWFLAHIKEDTGPHRSSAILRRVVTELCPFEVRTTTRHEKWISLEGIEWEGPFLGVMTFGDPLLRTYDHRFCFSSQNDAVQFVLASEHHPPRENFWKKSVRPKVIRLIPVKTMSVYVNPARYQTMIAGSTGLPTYQTVIDGITGLPIYTTTVR